ncbi:hypothetical protein [Streptomyces orinoci]|uniref:Uncharacterized protein n=1 Tax=Streptomyces orinoci TaxID=67339 RepID=A0ABV3K083_STRON|nr:hypothetical protein [Streptomyces orinoci]
MTDPAPSPAPIRVLRGTDLLDLTFSFPGLRIDDRFPGPRLLVPAGPGQDALLVVTFGPQHVVEHAFAEEQIPPEARDLPVSSLIGGKSVLVFEVGPSESVDYSEAGLLDAMRRLPLRVVDAAREAAAPRTLRPVRVPELTWDDPARALALVRLLRITAELTARAGPEATLAAATAAGAVIGTVADGPGEAVQLRTPENPFADPAHPATGVELPYRLVLSPPASAAWSHTTALGEPAPGERVELWHTRLSGTTARVVWNRDRDQDPGAPEDFRMPLDPVHRGHLTDLTANDTLTTPEGQPYHSSPVGVENLMLSAVGGWLDSLGEWPVRPAGIDLSQWRHRATMGRDHSVRVVDEGFLCPFGHRAALVTVTERKFTDARAAYLFQRQYILVRQPLRTYDPKSPLPADDSPTADLTNLLFPFTSVRIETLVTPNLRDVPAQPAAFFPETAADQPFPFKVTAVDHAGKLVEFRTPLMFVPESLGTGDELADVVAGYNNSSPPPLAAATAPPQLTSAALDGQTVALAPAGAPDDTSVDVAHLVWRVATPPGLSQPPPGEARFIPQLHWAEVSLPSAGALSGSTTTVPVAYARRYALSGFAQSTVLARTANTGEVFLQLLATQSLDFAGQGDRCGALLSPGFAIAGVSRRLGPVAGTAAGTDPLTTIANGAFSPAEFFRALDANLLGVLSLADIVQAAGLDRPLSAPRFFTQNVSAVTCFLTDLGRLADQLDRAAANLPTAARQVRDTGRQLARTIGDYLAQRLAGATGPVTLDQVDSAFTAFAGALDTLLNASPPGADPGLSTLLERVREQVATWNGTAGQLMSLRQAVQSAASGAQLPQTVNARLEWTPDIGPWPASDPVFAPRPDGRLTLIVDVRGSLRPDLTAGADISCALENFDLVLVPEFHAMRLHFRHIRFTMRAGRKPDVDVAFQGVEFIGPLAFVQTLRQLIPVDGFSDPPSLQVTAAGITARYGLPLPSLAIGVFSLENLRLDASLELPFIGGPLKVGFAFCSREAPFRLTVSMLGGGGFFGIVLTAKRVAVLEAALEFGAEAAIDFGVASGSLSVMAGIYFRLETDTGQARLTGYFRARGEVDVLGIVSASIELCLDLSYELSSGTVFGRARITIDVHIGFWSQSVTLECERRFTGSGPAPAALTADPVRPPAYAEMMTPYPDPVTGEHRDPVREYCTAFAEVS